MEGYAGKLLHVDLTARRWWVQDLEASLARDFIGGRGLAARLLFEQIPPGCDPLGAQNVFMVATGPMAGSRIPGSTRHITACKSPLTGGWGEANAAGRFGPMLKAAGYDAVLVHGRAEQPVYLWIHDGEVEIRPAGEIWGKFVADARDEMLRQTHPGAEVAVIGPAGENLVRFACVISENNRAAGRCGTGAVMGSKNLKGICVYGTGRYRAADPEGLAQLRREAVATLVRAPSTRTFREYGTAAGVAPHNALGMFPAFNFRKGYSPQIDAVTGESMTREILTGRETCDGCPVGCRRVVALGPPWDVDPRYGGPEFETIGALGTCVGVYDLKAIARANQLCNQYGVDTINTGLSIAWAMECFERGLLNRQDTGGRELRWGDAEVVFSLIVDIALNRGLGSLLGRGLREAAREVGGGSEAFALQVKNQSFPVHMPRGKVAQGLSYATSNRGACHTQGMHDTTVEKGNIMPEIGIDERFRGLDRREKRLKPELVFLAQNYRAFQDSLIACRFTCWDYGPLPPSFLARALEAMTGMDWDPASLMQTGERIFNLCRLFNVREGMGRSDDVLPARVAESLPEGATRGSVITPEQLQAMLEQYYRLRGWDIYGVPTTEKLEELGLDALWAPGR